MKWGSPCAAPPFAPQHSPQLHSTSLDFTQLHSTSLNFPCMCPARARMCVPLQEAPRGPKRPPRGSQGGHLTPLDPPKQEYPLELGHQNSVVIFYKITQKIQDAQDNAAHLDSHPCMCPARPCMCAPIQDGLQTPDSTRQGGGATLLGALGSLLGALGLLLGVLGRSWGALGSLFGSSWFALGSSRVARGRSWCFRTIFGSLLEGCCRAWGLSTGAIS